MADYTRLVPARPGDSGEDIAYVRVVLGVWPSGQELDSSTQQAIRGIQQAYDMEPTGLLDRSTFEIIKTIGDRRAGMAD